VASSIHGCLVVQSAHSIEEVEEEEAPAANGAAEGEKDAKKGDAKKEDTKKAEPKKTVKTVKKELGLTAVGAVGMSQAELRNANELELQMELDDKVVAEAVEAKDNLERYVYDMRDKLCGSLSEYAAEADKGSFTARLSATEDWLYDEGDEERKSVYVEKLAELRLVGDPIEARFAEAEGREASAAALTSRCKYFIGLAASMEEKHAHIVSEERDKVRAECEGALAWLAEKLSMQASNPKHLDPVVTKEDMAKKEQTVERFCSGIMNKPKPLPPKEEPKPVDEPMTDGKAKEDGDAPEAAGEAPKEANGEATKMEE